MGQWNQLDQRAVDAPSINVSKECLRRIRDKGIGFFMD